MKDSSGPGSSESGRARTADAKLAVFLFLLTLAVAAWVGIRLSTSPLVLREARLADGEAPTEGAPWDAVQTAALRSSAASSVVDLGSEQREVRIFLQADSNDTYRVESSRDGRRYEAIWDATPVGGGGLRSRASEVLPRVGRYLRIRPIAGDGLYTVGELGVAPGPGLTPPWRWVPATGTSELRTPWWLLVGLGCAIALGSASIAAFRVRAAGMALGAAAGLGGALMLLSLGPHTMQDELILGSLAAAIALLSLLLERWSRARRSRAPLVALAVASALAFGAFFHYGDGQFPDARDGSRTRVHYADLRNYFPTAKYFEELGYTGVYRASVLTWVESVAGGDLAPADAVAYRDLETHRMTTVHFDRPGLEALRKRFTPERFEALRADMEYFRALMGDYLYASSMIDHGGNATPLWLSVARLVFAGQPASDLLFELTGLLDLAAMLLLLWCVGRTYGVRSALVVGLAFGAVEFPNIANNWAGATLRHDWMVAFGLGMCALRSERHALSGALFAWSAGIRAFPALGLVLATLALALRAWSARRAEDASARERARALARFVGGAAGCAALIGVFSALTLGIDAWPEWLQKVRLLGAEHHLNHIGLPTFVHQLEAALHDGHIPGAVTIFGLAISSLVLPWALLRGVRGDAHDAALWGLLLVPLLSNPANYYGHLVCLVPLLGAHRQTEELSRAGWIMLLHAAATAILFAGSEHDLKHFEVLSLVYVVTLAALLVAERLVTFPTLLFGFRRPIRISLPPEAPGVEPRR